MLETKDLAVVILNWNGKSLLEKFLPSVIKHSSNAQIYVADNASTDDSLTFVSEHFPIVKLIQNTENSGYAKGYNDETPLLASVLSPDIPESDQPPNIYPPSVVWSTEYIKLPLLPPIVFCHTIAPDSSNFITQKSIL